MKTERAARREVSSAEARVTTEARLAETAGDRAGAEPRSCPAKVGRATTAEEAEVMAAISTKGVQRLVERSADMTGSSR